MPTSTLHPSAAVPSRAERPAAVVHQIGQTPLLHLRSLESDLPAGASVWAKGEHLNPGGSVKDRPALRMVREGLRRGALDEGRVLIDATSGNTGIAYAMLGAAFGFPVELALPENASAERKQILRAYGVELTFTDAMNGTDGARRLVRDRVEAHPDRYFYPNQYGNDANWRAHYDGTGAEILEQAEAPPAAFVAGLGTTGTFVGTTRRLKKADASIRCVAIQPDGPLHGLEGLKHLETAHTPGIYDDALPDDIQHIATEEAYAMTRRLAREEGLLVGPSSGANVAAALRVAQELQTGPVVTILCDTGTRYMGERFWQDE